MEISFEDRKAYWAEHQEAMRKQAPIWLHHIPRSDEFKAYLFYMWERLLACKQVLNSRGSIYLHCDWKASHYLKMVMDGIFGDDHFQNEIAWAYKTQGATKKRFARKHDTILFYTKSDDWTFNTQYEKSIMKHKYGFKGSDFKIDPETGQQYNIVIARDVWEISALQSATSEKIGYPTQKPQALLERIIEASSNEGDLVLDPFCGCGTAILAAHKRNRQWIGIDINKKAWEVVLELANQPSFYQWLNSFKQANYVSRDLDEVRTMNPSDFEIWANEYYGANKPYPDKYVDGITKEGIPIQTRATGTGVDFDEVHAFRSAMQYHPKISPDIKQGIFVSQNGFSDRAREAVAMIEAKEGITIHLATPEDMLELD
jgi:site-specific DNA-methyltransferase (adenine-specific)